MRWWKYTAYVLMTVLAGAFTFANEPMPAASAGAPTGDTGASEPIAKDGAAVSADERSMESRKLLEEVLMARLTRELSLSEEQSVLMVRHLAEFREKMADIRRERMTLARNLRQALRDNKDDETIGKMLEEVVAYEEKATAERRKFVDFEDFKLSTSQKARLYLFIVDFEGDMRRLLKQAQERRMGHSMKPGRDTPPPADSTESDGASPGEGGDSGGSEASSATR